MAAPEPPSATAADEASPADDAGIVSAPSFSDANNTGFDDSFAPDEPATPSPPTPGPVQTPDPPQPPPEPAEVSEPTAAFAAAPVPDASVPSPPSEEHPLPEVTSDDELDATSLFAATPDPAPSPPVEPDDDLPDETATAGSDAPRDDEGAPATEAPPAEMPVAADLEPSTPDELGVFPAITASGPPQYVPEPEPVPPPTPAPEEPAAVADEEPPELAAAGPDAVPAAPDELGEVPAVGPLATEPQAPDLVEPPETEPTPSQEAPPLRQPEPAALDAEPPPSPEPPTHEAIDPDGLISEVFADDLGVPAEKLVDGRPPAASDDLLDDADAWSDFAAGSAATAATSATSAPSTPSPAPASAPPVRPAAAPRQTGSFPGEDPDASPFFADAPDTTSGRRRATGGDGPRRPRRWSQTAIVALIVLGIIGAWFIVLAWITSGDDDPTAGAGDDPGTAAPSSSVVDQTTTAPTTSSTTSSTTTTTTTLAAIEPVGDPIPVEELGMGAFALGPLEFPAADGLGRLVATFDQPDAVQDVSGAMGLCSEDAGFTAQWGTFSAIFIGAPQTNVLVGYRLDAGGDEPFASLATLSGLQVGDTIETLEATYASFEISYQEIDGQPHFVLVRQSDATTLLWGPVSSSEPDGIVEGIYSPLPCDGGPAPSN